MRGRWRSSDPGSLLILRGPQRQGPSRLRPGQAFRRQQTLAVEAPLKRTANEVQPGLGLVQSRNTVVAFRPPWRGGGGWIGDGRWPG